MKTIWFALLVNSGNSRKDKIQIQEGQDVASSIKEKYLPIFGKDAEIEYDQKEGIVSVDYKNGEIEY